MNTVKIEWHHALDGASLLVRVFFAEATRDDCPPVWHAKMVDGERLRVRWSDPDALTSTTLHVVVQDVVTGYVTVAIDGPALLDDAGDLFRSFATAAPVAYVETLPELPRAAPSDGRLPLGAALLQRAVSPTPPTILSPASVGWSNT